MKTENTNDFSKCKIGDTLWSIYSKYGLDLETNCKIVSILRDSKIGVVLHSEGPDVVLHDINQADRFQALFFSRPQIIAPPEPPCLPDYKPGQIIAVWGDDCEVPYLRKFKEFQEGKIRVYSEGSLHNTEFGWPNHCTLEELPAVLAKMEEQKYAKECGVIR